MSLSDSLSPDIKPGNDFFGYVNQKWIDANPIPADRVRVGAFDTLNDENIEKLRVLIDQPILDGEAANIKLIKNYYRVAMDEASAEAASDSTVSEIIKNVSELEDIQSILKYISKTHAAGTSLIWCSYIEPDEKDSERYVIHLVQDGLALPNRDYYLEDNFAKILGQYKEFLTSFFTLLGITDPEIRAERIIELETSLAKSSMSRTEQRDPDKIYNPYSLEKLDAEYPRGEWANYLETLGLKPSSTVIVCQTEFLTGALDRLSTVDIAVWRDYLMLHSILPIMNTLGARYVDLNFSFYGKVLSGATELQPRYRRVIRGLMEIMLEPIGQLFVESHFDESAKAEIYDLVRHLQKAFGSRIDKLDWMSDITKVKAHAKLATFLPLLGYPDRWRNYDELKLGDNYTANYLAVSANEWRFGVSRLGNTVDRKQWLMSPVLVNACYWPNVNSITFPAGILQPPFFDASGDFAANYGSIGAVIGHEITHGFDDEGSKFDPQGNLQSWWTEEDRAEFDKRAEILVKQFESYTIGDQHVNGRLTLGENIADLGGLLMAYDALQEKLIELGERQDIDGYTPEQRFFIAYAVTWRENMRIEMSLQNIVTDPHAPAKYRANGSARNTDEFYAAFETTASDASYLSIEDRVRIW